MSCPCGSDRPTETCCGPYLAGEPAPTAEALMRSRYTAYVRRDTDYLFATHDPDTLAEVDRESTKRWTREATWLGLKVLDVVKGGPGDQEGEVEFSARWSQKREEHLHHERSLFRKREGRWCYVEGHTPNAVSVPVRRDARPGPNAPCPCGSGKKYKRCHGAKAGSAP